MFYDDFNPSKVCNVSHSLKKSNSSHHNLFKSSLITSIY
ncbi:hypothetical protein F383_32310 [Gossypium arboreum]|uniref:Uncharacterized protein n=1 Tax=Gossypium arboreum TaxID=29729 RepID=A0A0B0N2Y6_GOSAR|nr:hypothetical protein F383_32310 [Gossypium arboreum]